MESLSDPRMRAHAVSERSAEAGAAWSLSGDPSCRLASEIFRVATAQRLCMSIIPQRREGQTLCPLERHSQAVADPYGYHVTSCAAAKDLKTRAHTGVQDTVQKLLNGTNHVVTTASEYQLYGFPKHNLTARDAKPDLIITREGQPQGSAHTLDVGITRPGQHVPRAALTTPGALAADYERRKWTKLKNAYTVNDVNAKRVHMGCMDATGTFGPGMEDFFNKYIAAVIPNPKWRQGHMLRRTRH